MKKVIWVLTAALLLSGCTSSEVRRMVTGQAYDPASYSAEQRERDRIAGEQMARKREAAEAAQVDQNRVAANAERMVQDELRRQLQAGERQVSSLDDAILLCNPQDGTSLIMSPKASGGDGEYYQIHFVITDRQGSNYIGWDSRFGVGAIAVDPEIFGDARYNSPMVLVGRYAGNSKARLVNGRVVTVPMFDDAMLFAK